MGDTAFFLLCDEHPFVTAVGSCSPYLELEAAAVPRIAEVGDPISGGRPDHVVYVEAQLHRF